jgi:pimeloyl-ACP methyl ester carboxylesterase
MDRIAVNDPIHSMRRITMLLETKSAMRCGYASVNGIDLYYETYGEHGQPLVLIHGALSTIETSFGKLLPALAQTRQVIAIELQGHGRTADIDRPLSYEQMADDVAALLCHLNIETADVFGYSMGGGVTLQIAMRHPQHVRKLVIASATFNSDGIHPKVLAGFAIARPEDLNGSEWHAAYAAVAPHPEHWLALVAKVFQLDRQIQDWPPEVIRAINAPALVIIGDSDLVRPEHAVQMFRLLGGGVAGDLVGLPQSQLAVLPGITHVGLVERADLLLPIIPPFLDAPMQKPN